MEVNTAGMVNSTKKKEERKKKVESRVPSELRGLKIYLLYQRWLIQIINMHKWVGNMYLQA